jgi:hypothetical protein
MEAEHLDNERRFKGDLFNFSNSKIYISFLFLNLYIFEKMKINTQNFLNNKKLIKILNLI